MSTPTYEAITFLQEGSDFDLAVAARRLAEWLPNTEVTRRGKGIVVKSSGWEVRLHLMDEPYVAEESRDIAKQFADCPRAAEIGECERRVEVCSTDPDPDMGHFNDFVFVLHALEEFRGVILFDPGSGELI
jgi:hypothetical protein